MFNLPEFNIDSLDVQVAKEEMETKRVGSYNEKALGVGALDGVHEEVNDSHQVIGLSLSKSNFTMRKNTSLGRIVVEIMFRW